MIVDNEDVYAVGCSGSPALDPDDNALACASTISWEHDITFDENHLKEAILKITAEGIDGVDVPAPEIDNVYVNNTFVGTLTNQSFYSPFNNLNPGPGALVDFTELTMSLFDVTSLLVSGVNTIRVDVDPSNWVLEIETSSLTVTVPVPGSLALMGLGLAGIRYRRRKQIKVV